MKIIYNMGMLNIDTENMLYANIRNMYQNGKNGAGIQLSESLDNKRDDITDICDKIANLIYRLYDIDKATSESVSVPTKTTEQNEQNKV